MNIGILTDSTCDLSQRLLTEYSIDTIPLNINFSGKIYQDRVDIGPEEFYRKMITTEEIPRTSQPSVGLFLEKYKIMAEKYDVILSLHISGKLSGTIESARLAANQLPEIDIHIFDSNSTTFGLGFLVILARKMIKENLSVDNIISVLKEARDNLEIYFSVNDLKYLEKGGRIGKAQAFLGSVLNFNPILKLSGQDGEIVPHKKVRGNKKTRNEMLKICEKIIKDEERVWIGFLKGESDSKVVKFSKELKNMIKKYHEIEIDLQNGFISSVLASHTGPFVYGFVVLKGEFLEDAI